MSLQDAKKENNKHVTLFWKYEEMLVYTRV
jgi:hypothetical protein